MSDWRTAAISGIELRLSPGIGGAFIKPLFAAPYCIRPEWLASRRCRANGWSTTPVTIRSDDMHAKIELPKAFSVRDKHEFLTFQHLMARMNPKLLVKEVATGVHVDGGDAVHWGLVYLEGKLPSQKKVEIALMEAGFDFAHNVLTQGAMAWSHHASDEKRGW